jgi:hypothetical protein
MEQDSCMALLNKTLVFTSIAEGKQCNNHKHLYGAEVSVVTR